MDFASFVKGMISPKVLVVASPDATALCMKNNGLTFTQLLRPFGRIPNKSLFVFFFFSILLLCLFACLTMCSLSISSCC
jgi:hypothetical protein